MAGSLNGHSKQRRRRRADAFSEINVTPMVDVMLVLLVIFMVAAPMMTTGVSVDLPKASTNAVTGQDEPLSIQIDARGNLRLNETDIAPAELEKRLLAITKEKKDTRLFVYGDEKVDYGKVIEIFARLQVAGYNKVSLITDPSGKPAAKGR